MKNIATALLQAQKNMSNATKGSNNPFFKNKYADLNAVREAVIPALNEAGIVVLQPIVSNEGKNYVKTILLHSESGEIIESFTEIIFKTANDPQQQGSGITYARRYGLQSLVCIGAEDDDGETANGRGKATKQENKPAEKPVNKAKLDEKQDNGLTLQQVIDMAKKAKTKADLTVLWNEFKSMDVDGQLRAVVAQRGKEFNASEK